MNETKKTVEHGDFVEIDFKGMTKEGRVFDTTKAEIAKENDFFNPEAEYKPKIICIGEGHVLRGIDEQLIGKGIGKNYTIELESEKAFGKKTAKLLKLIPLLVFKKQKIEVVPGLQIVMDGTLATIKNVTGGRVIVDFNHPLAGQDIIYEVEVKKILTETKEKLEALMEIYLNTKDFEVIITEKKAEIKLKQKTPEEANDLLGKEIKRLIPELEQVVITEKKV